MIERRTGNVEWFCDTRPPFYRIGNRRGGWAEKKRSRHVNIINDPFRLFYPGQKGKCFFSTSRKNIVYRRDVGKETSIPYYARAPRLFHLHTNFKFHSSPRRLVSQSVIWLAKILFANLKMDSFYTKINRSPVCRGDAKRRCDPLPSRFVSSTNFKEHGDASSRIRNERIMAPMCIDNELG